MPAAPQRVSYQPRVVVGGVPGLGKGRAPGRGQKGKAVCQVRAHSPELPDRPSRGAGRGARRRPSSRSAAAAAAATAAARTSHCGAVSVVNSRLQARRPARCDDVAQREGRAPPGLRHVRRRGREVLRT